MVRYDGKWVSRCTILIIRSRQDSFTHNTTYLARYRGRNKRETSKFISFHLSNIPSRVRRYGESVDRNFFISRPPTRLVWSFLCTADCVIPFINNISFAEPCLDATFLPTASTCKFLRVGEEKNNVPWEQRIKIDRNLKAERHAR